MSFPSNLHFTAHFLFYRVHSLSLPITFITVPFLQLLPTRCLTSLSEIRDRHAHLRSSCKQRVYHRVESLANRPHQSSLQGKGTLAQENAVVGPRLGSPNLQNIEIYRPAEELQAQLHSEQRLLGSCRLQLQLRQSVYISIVGPDECSG
jgi:hypothetical protein